MNLYFLILLSIALLRGRANGDLTSKEFSEQFIKYILNSTNEKNNLAVAPQAAYELYQDLLNPPEPEPVHNFYWDSEFSTPSSVLELQSVMTRNLSDSPNNVLYTTTMRSRWGFNFQSRDMVKLQFFQYGSGDHRILTDFLRKDVIFSLWEMDVFNASVLELPLHLNEMRCLIILPNEYVSLEELKEFLYDNPDVFMGLQTKKLPMKLLRVLLPKFKVTHKQDLKDFYEGLSTGYQFYNYDSIQHETNLQANVFGIGQFDRTTVLFWNTYSYLRLTPQTVEVNRPFLFMITNKEHIQFFGQIVKL